MTDIENNAPLLSVHILLPDAVDRRVARWTEKMPGTSWPTWGGHITLVPNFRAQGSVDTVYATLEQVCRQAKPLQVRFAAPLATPDVTRPGYFALFLTVVEVLAPEESPRLAELRARVLNALADVREDVRPQLTEQPFMPHVTLALGLGEAEARKLARELRAEPLIAEFRVEVIWLLETLRLGDGAKYIRHPVPLGPVAPMVLPRA